MKQVKSIVAGVALLSALSFNAQANYVNTVDIAGDFDIYNFNPIFPTLPDADLSPFTYNLDLRNVTGKSEFNVPATGTDLDWFANGSANFTYGGIYPLPPVIFSNDMIFSGAFPFMGFSNTSYLYDFDTQTYTSTSGAFMAPIPGMPGVLNITYQILALDLDGIANDITMQIVESGFVDPMQTVSAMLNGLDTLPGSLTNGRIDGTFDIDMTITGVPEPTTALLFGLGLAGLVTRRRIKKA
ncbi:MAG: PEP-CTERM sorting domain-containing protein [Sedimenticola sp.]|nr:PEP-CTERM sorting domain-containing protein [Sedimenticola sp.]